MKFYAKYIIKTETETELKTEISSVKILGNFECSIKKCRNFFLFVKLKKSVINWMDAQIEMSVNRFRASNYRGD